jgi:hypothetical protein
MRMSLAMLEKRHYYFAGTTLYDGRVVPTTVENPRYNFKAYSSYTDAWETDAISNI